MAKEVVKAITDPDADYSKWYVDTVLKAELADYAPIRGCMVIRPYGYAIWERIQAGLDRRFKETGHANASFPLFIPEGLLLKEAQHVEGFAPEVAWVTQGGSEKLAERLAVRPTSEAIIGPMYAKWIQSYRDLPVLINQWCNVVRWEKVTRPFLRTTEFLWQEGHTAHRTEEEARAETLQMLEVYRSFLEHELAIPTVHGLKSGQEKFAGAEETYTVEALMGDGRALQSATSHYLGTHFAEAFDITFLDQDGTQKHAYTTSWGLSTRVIGALIMVHGDERGLVLPPRIAPTQVVIVPIAAGPEAEAVLTRARGLKEALAKLCRVELDARREYTPGWKFNEWEMRGVPVRLEIGPRDLKAGQAVMVRRDTKEKIAVPQEDLATQIPQLLGDIQDELLRGAQRRLASGTHHVQDFGELAEVMSGKQGLASSGWCGRAACESRVKEETGATLRVLPLRQEPKDGCVVCGEKAAHHAIWGRAY